MTESRRCFCLAMLFALIVVGSSWMGSGFCADDYPSKAIEVVVPFQPGGGTDMAARIVGDYASKKWGVPVNVVNKPGGNTVPACLEVYGARPDGYVLLGDSMSSTSTIGAAVKNLPFKVMDRTFIAMTTLGPFFIIVPPQSPYNNLQELAKAAKENPGEWTWTSTGGASGLDVTGRQFFKAIGVDVTKTKPVMAQGGAPSVTITAGGHVKMGLGASSAMAAITGKLVKTVAVTTAKRWPDLPDIPTTAEQGFPSVNCQYWTGFSGPPGLPDSVVGKWNAVVEEALKDPKVVDQLRKIGVLPYYLNSAETREYAKKEVEEILVLWGIK